MTRTSRIALVIALAIGAADGLSAGDRLKVIATLPNLGSIAELIGGDRVEVTTIASGLQDAHFVDPKPSYIVRLRSADLLLVNGLDLEIGWVPPLTLGARNASLLPGAPDYIDCSTSVRVIEVPTAPVSRAQGDVHPYGNPHYLTDPLNAEIVAGQIANAFKRKSPADAAWFEDRRAAFTRRLHEALFGADLVDLAGGAKLSRLAIAGDLERFLSSSIIDGRPLTERIGGWFGAMRPFTGAKVVTYHKDYSYFANRFGLDIVDYVEPKPGIPPSAKHLAELTGRLQGGDIRLLITRPYVEHRSTDLLAEESGVPVLTLPLEVGGAPGATDYFTLFDLATSQIAGAIRAGKAIGK